MTEPEKSSILIVEDEAISANNLAKILNDSGFLVNGIASDGKTAIEMSVSTKPDLILMDINITGSIDGIETAKRILEQQSLPVVFLTAYSDDDTISRVKQVSSYGYILKPFRVRDLVITIEMAIAKFRYEAEIKESDNRYRFLANIAPLGIFSVDRQGSISEINKKQLSLMGLSSASAVKNLNISESPTLKSTGIAKDIFECMETGGNSISEYQYLAPDGKVLHLKCNITPIINGNDEITGVLVISEDISEGKANERKLYESEDILAVALAGSELGLLDWNIVTDEATYDYQWADMLGYTQDELNPHISSWKKLIHPEDKNRVEENLRIHLSGESDIFESEHRLKTKQGEWNWILSRGVIIRRNAEGNPDRMVITNYNINRYRLLEDDIRDFKEKVSIIFNSLPGPAIIWEVIGEDYVLVDYNRSYIDLFSEDIVSYKGVEADLFYDNCPEIYKLIDSCYKQKTVIVKTVSYCDRIMTTHAKMKLSLKYLPADSVIISIDHAT